jgi:bacterioferritin-associated ferredoxin
MVTKCICSDKLFSEIKETADRYELKNIDELKEYMQFGGNCRLCFPYIELMLKTGKTEFEVIMNDNC